MDGQADPAHDERPSGASSHGAQEGVAEALRQPLAEAIEVALQRSVRERLTMMSMVMSIVFAVFAILEKVGVFEASTPVAVSDTLTFLLITGIWIVARRRLIPLRWMHLFATAVMLLLFLNILFTLVLDRDQTEIQYALLMIVVGGVVMLSVRWLVFFLAMSVPCWIVASYVVLDPMPVADTVMMMCIAAVISTAFCMSRRARVVQLQQELRERLQSEEALRKSEERYRRMLDGQGEGVGLSDLDEKFLFSNPAAETIFGVGAGGLVGRDLRQFLSSRGREQVRRETALRGQGEMSSYELEIIRPDGAVRQILVTASPWPDLHGNLAGTYAVFRDITEQREQQQVRRALQEKLMQTQKLESLGVLAGGIAHDFNNLLVGMLGNAALVAEKLPADSELLEEVEGIQLAASHAADLCQQMLAYSGKGRFVVERVDLTVVVEDLRQIVGSPATRMVEWNYALETELPDIEVDVAQVRQVVMNLLTNAAEAQKERPGVIQVTTGIVEVVDGEPVFGAVDLDLEAGPYVYLSVSDQGVGMDEETLARIFDPFFTTKFTGRGLGLAAVLGIVRGHQGAVQVTSRPREGSTFRVMLPVAAAAEEIDLPIGPTPPRWEADGVVLVVDDEPVVRRVLQRMLENMGLEVLLAECGPDAIDIYRERGEGIDLVIMDQTMPKMNGAEAFQAIRKLDPMARVMLSSGYAEEELNRRHGGLGWSGFLAKPYEPADLVEKLQQVFGD